MHRFGEFKFWALAAVFFIAGSAPLAHAATSGHAQTIPGLGTATFATSTSSAAAQTDFMHGLLLLHVFEYEDAAKWFRAAEKIDPGFAMAYWGEAMTFNHPVWNEVDVKAGQAALKKFGVTPEARAQRIQDPRERAYMAAVEILYSGTGTKRERDAQYADAMRKLSQDYPTDDEAQLFYALALLGRSEGVRDVPTYLQAAGIAKAVFMRNPDHPGAAHYWIHGMDDPQHAAGALVAARALSKIAPDAAHAQHMCSHIFMALGMWNAVVKANQDAMKVVDEHARAAGQPVFDCGHYDIWLEYGYYQQGRIKDGDGVLAQCRSTGTAALEWMGAHPGQPVGRAQTARELADEWNASLVDMRGIAVIGSRSWAGRAAKMAVDASVLHQLAGWDAFTSGYAEAQLGDLTAARDSLARLRGIQTNYAAAPAPDKEDEAYLSILADDLSGLISSKAGDLGAAIAEVQHAATIYEGMAFDFGPPVMFKPPHELLGELLLKESKPAEACEAFEASLKRAPKRTESLLGLARAERAMGDKSAATITYRELLQIWTNADAGNVEAAEAHRYAGPEIAEK
jgi:tetratricopeptide (TPR) repeat protein